MSSAAVQSILVPLSGLTLSSRAAAYGIYVAKRLNVPLIGLYAGKPLEGSPTEEILIRNFHEDCRRAGISPDLRKIPDLSPESISAAVNDPESSLLLVPRTNQEDSQNPLSCIPDIAIGSIKSSLMILPPQFLEIESMGLIYDGRPESDLALALAATLSRSAVWPLTILLISEDQRQIADLSEQLEDYFEQNDNEGPIDWIVVALSGPEDETALQFIRDGSIELLVMAVTDMDSPCRSHILQESRIPLIVTR
ncbi:hypothetical protein SAMN04489760_105163 [Syntrophus gentianae]|uniref:Universal stress protein family protein n=1 Tax=Syntrophus gentianae TaxID=43775 RepID=A0A1H7W467_9BACT|nr:universal stress protein [Syntrophus gentianae]SEM16281.1 hypothetical protein SAMN04489760_105163 [Syntrophus gentianae]